MFSFRRTMVATLLCAAVSACGGGGGGDGGAPAPTPTPAPTPVPTAPPPNTYLPTDTTIRLTYSSSGLPAQFEAAVNRNSQFVAPFVYPTGGKEYYVSTQEAISFAGFYSPQVIVSGVGSFTADARFNTPVLLLRSDWGDTLQSTVVSGSGTVNITPTYGEQPLTYSGTVSYQGTALLTSALGTFSTKHVRVQLTVSTTIQGTVFTVPFFVDFWFARDLGIVLRTEAGQALQLAQAIGPDRDGDGLFNGIDAFPDNPAETLDSDADGTGNNADTDDDNDNVPDAADRFPRNPSESADFDNDGVGDNGDTDDDNDGVPDIVDPFPRNVHNTDTDHDTIPDFFDDDDDGDGVLDVVDLFPLNPAESADADGDGMGDNGDTDDDNDSVWDVNDAYPNNPTRWELFAVNQASLSFAAVFGSSVMPASQVIVAGDNIQWQVLSAPPWVQLSRNSGTGDATVQITTDTTGLAVGTHTEMLTFKDLGDGRAVDVEVQITVSVPILSLSTTSLIFDGKFGWSPLTKPIHVSLNTGGNMYPVDIAFTFDVPGGIEIATDDGVADAGQHRNEVTILPENLNEGRHVGEFTFTADVNGHLIARTVDVEVLASERVLYPSEDGVALAKIGTHESLERTVTILDSYKVAETPWTVSDDGAWLETTANGDELTIEAVPGALADGLYEATITLSSTKVARTMPIKVSLWVQSSEDADVAESLAATYSQIASDPLRPYIYVHNGSGTIDVYNVHTRTAGTSITGLTGTLGPMTASSDGKWLFVLNPTNGSVTRIDLGNPAVRVNWPLTELKPADQPKSLAHARPNGHPVIVLGDRRAVDAETGAVFPAGELYHTPQIYFDIVRASRQGDRVCVVNTQFAPTSGGCFDLFFGTYDTPDVRSGPLAIINGHDPIEGLGFATDLAVTTMEPEALVGTQSSAFPVHRYNALVRQYMGALISVPPTSPGQDARGIAISWDGSIFANVRSRTDQVDRLYSLNADHSVRSDVTFGAGVSGLMRQLVVTGDGLGIAYLTGTTGVQQFAPAVSTEVSFRRTY